MTSQRKGKTYEALLKVVLDLYRKKNKLKSHIFWNETPEGVSNEPDFSIGPDKDHPEIIFMVTHSGSSKNSDMKCWRNIGELCEAKSVLEPTPLAVNIVFDAVMKENLKRLQSAAFDGQLIIGDLKYGGEITQWVNEHEELLPINQEEKANIIASSLKTDKKLSFLVSKLVEDVAKAIKTPQIGVNGLWNLEKQRLRHPGDNLKIKKQRGKLPIAKDTFIRRGFTKRLLVGEALSGKRISIEDGTWLEKVGIVRKTISGYRIIDEELLWFLNTPFESDYKNIATPCMTEGFISQIERVRSLGLIEEYKKYVINNYNSLITSNGMLECLRQQHRNPSQKIKVPCNTQPPSNVWIYDFIAALSTAAAKRSQAFGYSSFSQHPKGQQSRVGNTLLGRWVTNFINQYFNRKPEFSLPKIAEKFVAEVLAEELRKYNVETIISLSNSIFEKFVSKEYEAVLLAHRGFEPLLAILINNNIVAGANSKVSIRTCFAEKAGLTGQAGKTTVIQVKNTIINWQSAYSGSDSKRKELCGRAVGLRYTWDSHANKFVSRPGVKKLILLLDGTWSQKDLNALVNAGWDEIYYPDEIDKLKAAIV